MSAEGTAGAVREGDRIKIRGVVFTVGHIETSYSWTQAERVDLWFLERAGKISLPVDKPVHIL